MWRRVFPYFVASATGIVSGVYIFKPLILEKVDTETDRERLANLTHNIGRSKLTENDVDKVGFKEKQGDP